MCEKDSLVAPGGSYERVAEILGDKVQVIKCPIGHFDIYHGDTFKKVVSDQINFIKKIVNLK